MVVAIGAGEKNDWKQCTAFSTRMASHFGIQTDLQKSRVWRGREKKITRATF